MGGKRSKDFNKGYFYEPTVMNDVPDNADIMQVEPFGPVAPIVKFHDLEEGFAKANNTNFGLAGYVFTTSLKNAHLASEKLEVGMVGVTYGALRKISVIKRRYDDSSPRQTLRE